MIRNHVYRGEISAEAGQAAFEAIHAHHHLYFGDASVSEREPNTRSWSCSLGEMRQSAVVALSYTSFQRFDNRLLFAPSEARGKSNLPPLSSFPLHHRITA